MNAISEMIGRDKNRASVLIWSLANEPRSTQPGTSDYFKVVAAHAKHLDPTRPTIVVVNQNIHDQATPHSDLAGINRYYGWYSNPGELDLIGRQLVNDLHTWLNVSKKPVLVTEFGADAVTGLHMDPGYIFSEDYQAEFLARYHKAFDRVRAEGGALLGEMVWNLADFMTKQQGNRVGGNRKGIFTRNRQPKMAARVVRRRYWHLARLESSWMRNVTFDYGPQTDDDGGLQCLS